MVYKYKKFIIYFAEQAVKNQIFDEYDYGKLHCRG